MPSQWAVMENGGVVRRQGADGGPGLMEVRRFLWAPQTTPLTTPIGDSRLVK